MLKKSDLGFRAWFYFRNGWGLYFAFLFAAINTLTVTYYLAIDRIPFLLGLFPTFLHYILITVSIGVPLLILIGFVHYKRSGARKAEVDIGYEVDPYRVRTLVNSEILLKLNFDLLLMLTKLLNDEKLTTDEIETIKKSQSEITKFIKDRNFKNKLDLKYIKTESQES